jgi:hypothetical protein
MFYVTALVSFTVAFILAMVLGLLLDRDLPLGRILAGVRGVGPGGHPGPRGHQPAPPASSWVVMAALMVAIVAFFLR